MCACQLSTGLLHSPTFYFSNPTWTALVVYVWKKNKTRKWAVSDDDDNNNNNNNSNNNNNNNYCHQKPNDDNNIIIIIII